MPKAHMVRNEQQWRLIGKLLQKITDKINEISGSQEVMDGFVDWVHVGDEDEDMEHLQALLKRELIHDLLFALLYHQDESDVSGADYPDLIDFYVKEVLGPLMDFARAPEEFEALRVRLIARVIESLIQYPAEAELRRVGDESPQVIFHAPSAMSEIEIPED